MIFPLLGVLLMVVLAWVFHLTPLQFILLMVFYLAGFATRWWLTFHHPHDD